MSLDDWKPKLDEDTKGRRKCEDELSVHGPFSFVRSNVDGRWLVCGPSGAEWTIVRVRRKFGMMVYRALGPELRKLGNGKSVYTVEASISNPGVPV